VDKRTKIFTAVGAGLMAALALTATPANADPVGSPTYRQLVGVGSDTTQGVMNGLSDVVLDGTGTKLIGSYDAVGSATITTKDPATTPACTNIARPAGSGNGVNALVASVAAGNGCIQFARSSSNSAASHAGQNLTYIPFAVDALTYAVRSDSTISKKLTKTQLTSVYNCTAGVNFKPLLPHFGSGTRSFFLSQLGMTDSADFVTLPGHTCIADTDATGAPIEEHTGTALTDPKHIAPYSVAQYISQVNGIVPDIHGKTVLAQLDGIPPVVLNTSATMSRDVYNVVPTGQLSDPTYNGVFVGPGSSVCSNTATIKKFGFGANANCGSTSIQTP